MLSDESLKSIRLRTSRITISRLLKLISIGASGTIAALAAIVLTYWAWIDQHRYFAFTNEFPSPRIGFYYGTPRLAGFSSGLRLWDLDLFKKDVIQTPTNLARFPFVISHREDPVKVIAELLSDAG